MHPVRKTDARSGDTDNPLTTVRDARMAAYQVVGTPSIRMTPSDVLPIKNLGTVPIAPGCSWSRIGIFER